MNKGITKFVCFLLVFCLAASYLSLCLGAEQKDKYPDTSKAKAVCLYNFNTDGNVLSTGMQDKLFPTGAVKMMTGLIACEMLSDRLGENVLITEEMLSDAEGANIKLKAGMSVSLENLLYGVLCGGGNDAALALATVCAGSVDGFVDVMNAKAKEWGLQSTHFTNPTGIDDKKMYSTLSDIMIIAKRAAKNDMYIKASSAMSYIYTPKGETEEVKFFNRNALISTFYSLEYRNPNAQGLISGSTDLGGNCVITFVQKGETEYICAVMGAKESGEQYEIANDLIDYAFDKLAYRKIAESGTAVCTLPVELALPQSGDEQVTIPCVIKDDIYALTFRDIDVEGGELQYRPYFHRDKLTAPVGKGVIVGGVDIIYDGEIIGHSYLITAESIQAGDMLVFMESLKGFFVGRAFILSLIFFMLLFGAYHYFTVLRFKRKNVREIKSFKQMK